MERQKDLPTVAALWEMCNHLPMKSVAAMHGMTVQALVGEFKENGLLGNRKGRDPSPSEIAERARLIREVGFGKYPPWDEETERKRWIAARRLDGGVL